MNYHWVFQTATNCQSTKYVVLWYVCICYASSMNISWSWQLDHRWLLYLELNISTNMRHIHCCECKFRMTASSTMVGICSSNKLETWQYLMNVSPSIQQHPDSAQRCLTPTTQYPISRFSIFYYRIVFWLLNIEFNLVMVLLKTSNNCGN